MNVGRNIPAQSNQAPAAKQAAQKAEKKITFGYDCDGPYMRTDETHNGTKTTTWNRY